MHSHFYDVFKYLYTVDLDSPHTRASSVRFIVPATNAR